MTAKLTEKEIALLDEPQIACLTTVNADGSLQTTPVWVETDGESVLFNTAKGRVKHRNIERDPRVSLVVVDNADPYRWVSVSGRAELSDEEADDQIDRLAKKYTGEETYTRRREGEVRVSARVAPERLLSR